MKSLKLIVLFLLLPIVFYAQHSLTGLWTGTLSNDSTTIRKDQSYEIALTEYKGKVYGYSRSTFIVNDTLYYMVKRVKGSIDSDMCEIKDDEIISCNFPGKLDKGIKVTTTFRLNLQDTTWHLQGEWKTNKTKNFYSVSGTIALREEKNLDNSKILPHLEELKKADDLAFYTASKKQTTPAPEIPVIAVADKKLSKKEQKEKEPVEKKETTSLQKDIAVKTDKKSISADTEKKQKPVTDAETKAIVKEQKAVPLITEKKPEPAAAAFVEQRKLAVPQIVSFRSDSLQLALYDNGEIDGDTVSVLLNNEVIIAKQGLKTSATKKTIYIDRNTDEITLVLYAENLGKYPPNTGLLVVHDGDEVYQIRFSADLQQNAAIVFKRKK